jgi:DNA polymerase
MMPLADKLRSRTWSCTASVPGVPGELFAHEEPVEEEIKERDIVGYIGSYRTSVPAGTASTSAPERPRSPLDSSCFWPHHLPRLVLDIETYYDAAYNLDKLDTIAYTFDPRFHLHGIAVAYPDGRAEFRTDPEVLLAELRQAYGNALENVVVACHNAAFDLFVLRQRFGLTVTNSTDTMLLSRLLHGADEDHDLRALATRYGLPDKGDIGFMKGVRHPSPVEVDALRQYAANDAIITAGLANLMIPMAADRPIELWAIQHSLQMYVERPLTINRARLQATQDILEPGIAAKVKASGLSEEVIRSTKRFPVILAAALHRTGRTLPMKPSKKGPIAAISKKDPAQAEFLADPDPTVRALMEAKVAVSSAANVRSRLAYLQHAATAMGGRVALIHSYHKAGPGRYAGGDGFNVQNLKKCDTGEGSDEVAAGVRASIQAAAGKVLDSADASQIEARILAFLAGQNDLHQSFARGIDIYSEFATRHLGRPVRKPTAADPPQVAAELRNFRQIGKQAILGLGYRMGVEGFIHALKSKPALAPLLSSGVLNEATCARIVYGYREQYARIKAYWDDAENAALQAVRGTPTEIRGCRFTLEGGALYLRLPSGRRLVYPKPRIEAPTYGTTHYIDRNGVRCQALDDRLQLCYGDGTQLYGGLIVENIVQATARDLLVDVMYRTEAAGFPIVLHCHDSVTVCVSAEQADAAAALLISAWRQVPAWMNGLVLDAEAKTGTDLSEL